MYNLYNNQLCAECKLNQLNSLAQLSDKQIFGQTPSYFDNSREIVYYKISTISNAMLMPSNIIIKGVSLTTYYEFADLGHNLVTIFHLDLYTIVYKQYGDRRKSRLRFQRTYPSWVPLSSQVFTRKMSVVCIGSSREKTTQQIYTHFTSNI